VPSCTTAFLWQALTLNKEYSFQLASLFNITGKDSGQYDDRLCDRDAKSNCFAFVPPHAPALWLMRASHWKCVELRLKTKNEQMKAAREGASVTWWLP
jgi:hypothetical protein